MFPLIPTLVFLSRSLVVAVAVGGVAYGAEHVFETVVSDEMTKIMLLAKLVVAGIAAGITFVLAVWIVKLREPLEMVKFNF